MNMYKFSETATTNCPDILNGISEIDFLKSKYQDKFSFGLDNLHNNGVYKLQGWCFDFKHILKKYIVKQYGSLQEYYAINKSTLRKSIFGKIQYIQEVNIINNKRG